MTHLILKTKTLDFFGIYDLEDGKTYLIPSSVLKNHKKTFKLRKDKSKNNQTKNINLASEYEISKCNL